MNWIQWLIMGFLQAANVAVTVLIAMRITRAHYSATRAASLLERFSSGPMVEMRHEIEMFLSRLRRKEPRDRIETCRKVCERLGDNAKLFNKLHALGMFFSEIGFFVEAHIIDPGELRIFDRLIPYYWSELTPFIIACHYEFGYARELLNGPDAPPLEPLTDGVWAWIRSLFDSEAEANDEPRTRKAAAEQPAARPYPKWLLKRKLTLFENFRRAHLRLIEYKLERPARPRNSPDEIHRALAEADKASESLAYSART